RLRRMQAQRSLCAAGLALEHGPKVDVASFESRRVRVGHVAGDELETLRPDGERASVNTECRVDQVAHGCVVCVRCRRPSSKTYAKREKLPVLAVSRARGAQRPQLERQEVAAWRQARAGVAGARRGTRRPIHGMALATTF